jgi:rod shape-determining protein MreC
LQALLAFKEQFISQTMAAQVIGSTGSEQSRGIYLDKGEKDGIRPDMAVITADGIVGKVLHSYRSTSLVLLISDPSSGVGAIMEKTRLQGILRGMPSGEIALEKVMSDEQVPPGELVLSSGGDRIFPKGLPIGRVKQVSPGSDLFLNIQVKPTVNLSKLEEVLIVTRVDERQATPDQAGPVRAADVLAERLPTVPPKPPEPSAATGVAAQPGAAAPENQTPPKPKPATSTGNAVVAVPVARKTVISAPPKNAVDSSADGTAAGQPPPKAAKPAEGTAAGETPQKTVKPADEPKPQPPSQDTPQ